jgi:hypothetical protein
VKRSTSKKIAGALVAVTCLVGATSTRAWVRQNLRDQPGFSNHDLFLPSGRLRVSIERDGSATADDGSDLEAIRAAMRSFEEAPGSLVHIDEAEPFDFPPDVESRDGFTLDGVNRLYFFQADDPAFHAVALTAVFFEPTTGRILESDTAVNEADYVFSTRTTTDPNEQLGAAVLDLQEVITHEFFHSFGFDHSAVAGRFDPTTGLQVAGWYTGDWSNQATLFPIASGTISGRTLQPDDVAALASVYPDGSSATGKIAGRVVDGATGQGLKGAHVVAVRAEAPDVPVVGTITGTGETGDPGAFMLSGLPPDSYFVRIEPLAGTSNPFTERSTQYRGFVTAFTPEFYSGARESLLDAPIAPDDAAEIVVARGEQGPPITVITNSVPPPPVANAATFRGGKLIVSGGNFVTAATAFEIDGRLVTSMSFPKKKVKANGIATKFTSKDPGLADVLATSASPTLVVVETATGRRSLPVPIRIVQ